MERYSIIKEKDPREIVLLKSYPCKWGRCSFCDYIDDNSEDLDEMIRVNKEALSHIKGIYGKLEVINSASTFELPLETLEEIREIAYEKNIKTILFEVFLGYRNRFDELREFFKGIDLEFIVGIETFDDDFRENVLNKKIQLGDLDQLAKEVDSICLLVGVQGQTKEMIKRDMDLAKKFKRVTINIYRNNSTPIKRDQKLVEWFVQNYKDLAEDPDYDLLLDPTDFGVGN